MTRIRVLGRRDYAETLDAMRAFTADRGERTLDEIWLLEHPPVYTLGLAGRDAHVLDAGAIPVVRTERGGQVTYHGPGQVVAYLLLDLRRLSLGVRDLVARIEDATIALLAAEGVPAVRRAGAPGVYVAADHPRAGGAKIASLGLKVSRGCSYHGVALNVAMDLSPFSRIDPCGYPGLEVTDLARATGRDPAAMPVDAVAQRFGAALTGRLAAPARGPTDT